MQGFGCESILFKKAISVFGSMEIAESIYEGVVEPSYKKYTWAYSKRYGHIRNKRGGATSSEARPVTVESTGKRRKLYVDFSKSE